MITNPLPWAIGLGCAATATGFQLWGPAMSTVDMLADGASPVALFTIGAVLARARIATLGTPAASAPSAHAPPARQRFGDVPQVVLYKLIVHPALVFGVGKLAQGAGTTPRPRHRATARPLRTSRTH